MIKRLKQKLTISMLFILIFGLMILPIVSAETTKSIDLTLEIEPGSITLEVMGDPTLSLTGNIDHQDGTTLAPVAGQDQAQFTVKDNRGSEDNYQIQQTFSEFTNESGTTLEDAHIESINMTNVGESNPIDGNNSPPKVESPGTIFTVDPTESTVFNWTSTLGEMKLNKVFVEEGNYTGTLTTEILLTPETP